MFIDFVDFLETSPHIAHYIKTLNLVGPYEAGQAYDASPLYRVLHPRDFCAMLDRLPKLKNLHLDYILLSNKIDESSTYLPMVKKPLDKLSIFVPYSDGGAESEEVLNLLQFFGAIQDLSLHCLVEYDITEVDLSELRPELSGLSIRNLTLTDISDTAVTVRKLAESCALDGLESLAVMSMLFDAEPKVALMVLEAVFQRAASSLIFLRLDVEGAFNNPPGSRKRMLLSGQRVPHLIHIT